MKLSLKLFLKTETRALISALNPSNSLFHSSLITTVRSIKSMLSTCSSEDFLSLHTYQRTKRNKKPAFKLKKFSQLITKAMSSTIR